MPVTVTTTTTLTTVTVPITSYSTVSTTATVTVTQNAAVSTPESNLSALDRVTLCVGSNTTYVSDTEYAAMIPSALQPTSNAVKGITFTKTVPQTALDISTAVLGQILKCIAAYVTDKDTKSTIDTSSKTISALQISAQLTSTKPDQIVAGITGLAAPLAFLIPGAGPALSMILTATSGILSMTSSPISRDSTDRLTYEIQTAGTNIKAEIANNVFMSTVSDVAITINQAHQILQHITSGTDYTQIDTYFSTKTLDEVAAATSHMYISFKGLLNPSDGGFAYVLHLIDLYNTEHTTIADLFYKIGNGIAFFVSHHAMAMNVMLSLGPLAACYSGRAIASTTYINKRRQEFDMYVGNETSIVNLPIFFRNIYDPSSTQNLFTLKVDGTYIVPAYSVGDDNLHPGDYDYPLVVRYPPLLAKSASNVLTQDSVFQLIPDES
ncbi:hypothetical protein HDU86_001341, partial [Geranomyces michiganensis]